MSTLASFIQPLYNSLSTNDKSQFSTSLNNTIQSEFSGGIFVPQITDGVIAGYNIEVPISVTQSEGTTTYAFSSGAGLVIPSATAQVGTSENLTDSSGAQQLWILPNPESANGVGVLGVFKDGSYSYNTDRGGVELGITDLVNGNGYFDNYSVANNGGIQFIGSNSNLNSINTTATNAFVDMINGGDVTETAPNARLIVAGNFNTTVCTAVGDIVATTGVSSSAISIANNSDVYTLGANSFAETEGDNSVAYSAGNNGDAYTLGSGSFAETTGTGAIAYCFANNSSAFAFGADSVTETLGSGSVSYCASSNSEAYAFGSGGYAETSGSSSLAYSGANNSGAYALGAYSDAETLGSNSFAYCSANNSEALALGPYSTAEATGSYSTAETTGSYCAAETTGINSSAIATGPYSSAVGLGSGDTASATGYDDWSYDPGGGSDGGGSGGGGYYGGGYYGGGYYGGYGFVVGSVTKQSLGADIGSIAQNDLSQGDYVGASAAETGRRQASESAASLGQGTSLLEKAKWDSNVITWSMANDQETAEGGEYEADVKNAFATWAAASGLTFEEVSNSSPSDISIGFADLNTDSSGVIGYTSLKEHEGIMSKANIQLEDPTKNALITGSDGELIYARTDVDLSQVLLHEIGHSLGLAESTDSASVMYYELGAGNRILDHTDLAGINLLYGTATSSSIPTNGSADQLIQSMASFALNSSGQTNLLATTATTTQPPLLAVGAN